MDVVFDSVGKDTFDASLATLRPRGMMVLYGQSSGAVPPVDPQRLNQGGALFLTRPSLPYYVATREELVSRASELFDWVRDGELSVRIGETHQLAAAAEAHRRLAGRAPIGKIQELP
jgi:NADPH:quinone reductase